MFNFSVRIFFHCIYHVKLDLSRQLNESVTIQFTQRVIKYADWILMFILIILMFCCVTWIDGWGYSTTYAHFLRNDIFVVRVLHFLPINRHIDWNSKWHEKIMHTWKLSHLLCTSAVSNNHLDQWLQQDNEGVGQ